VTGRYWGFLSLPLSLLSAAALWHYASRIREGWRSHVFFALVLIFQLGFQAETLVVQWLHSPAYRLSSDVGYFQRGPEAIQYAAIAEEDFQGEVLSPTRGVANCYDMDDFTRAKNDPDTALVSQVLRDGTPDDTGLAVRGTFINWSRIRLSAGCVGDGDSSCVAPSASRVQMVLQQAYHPFWSAAECATSGDEHGNLVLDCPASSLRNASIDLAFKDTTSELGATVSLVSWKAWIVIAGVMMLARVILLNRSLRTLLARPAKPALRPEELVTESPGRTAARQGRRP
jgi:hypothetical protein